MRQAPRVIFPDLSLPWIIREIQFYFLIGLKVSCTQLNIVNNHQQVLKITISLDYSNERASLNN